MANSHIAIQITNLREIKSAFDKSPFLMAKELDIAIKKTVLIVHGQSVRNTPVDTGRLRASTYSKFQPLRGEVGTNTNYDVFVHEGTKFMKARPYLKDAVESSNVEANRFFTSAVDNVLSTLGKAT